jgi:predicted MFS family arabinose efflux permease
MLLWTGQAVSSVGTEVSQIAYPLLVLAMTGSAAQAGVVGFARTLPFLVLYAIAGVWVDRLDRRRVMLVCDAVRALALASIPVALALGGLTVAQVAIVAFVEGAALVFFYLSEGAALPHVVTPAQLPSAVARNEARAQAAELVGRPLGGVLFALGRAVPFVVDAATYAAGFAALLGVRSRLQEPRAPGERRALSSEMAEGGRFLWRQPLMRTIAVLVCAVNFLGGALVLVLIVRAQDLGASSSLIGALFVLSGAAGIAGAGLAPALARSLPPAVVILGALGLWCGTIALMAVAPSVALLAVVYAAYVVAGPVFNVVLSQYRYALVPDRLLARVQSVSLTVGWGSIPLGSLAGGLLAGRFGASSALLVLAGCGAVVGAAVTATPTIRRAPPPTRIRRGR